MPHQGMMAEMRWPGHGIGKLAVFARGTVDCGRPGLQFFQPCGGGVFDERQRGGGMEHVGKVG